MQMRGCMLIAVALLAGCGLQNVKLYEGPERPAEQSVLSSLALDRTIDVTLQVIRIDGNEVNTTNAASFLLLPGAHRVYLSARKDVRTGSGPAGGISYEYKGAEGEVMLEAKAGHTYIPAAIVRGDSLGFHFDDKGEGYPQECLPLYQVVNGGGIGFSVHSDGRTCDR